MRFSFAFYFQARYEILNEQQLHTPEIILSFIDKKKRYNKKLKTSFSKSNTYENYLFAVLVWYTRSPHRIMAAHILLSNKWENYLNCIHTQKCFKYFTCVLGKMPRACHWGSRLPFAFFAQISYTSAQQLYL